MIKVSFIAPTRLIERYGNRGDFHLALAHLVGPINRPPNLYERMLVDSKMPIYLDNGLFENKKSIPVRELMEKAVHLNAEYVFAPDVLFDRKGTEENIYEAYDILEEIKQDFPDCKTKLAAVVQADNFTDYLESYKYMAENDKVSLIGLSILSIPESFKKLTLTEEISPNRQACLAYLSGQTVHKDSHLLGAGSSYDDVVFAANNCPWVVSHDSSSAIWNGIQGKIIMYDLTVEGGKTKVPVDFNYQQVITREQNAMIGMNIDAVLRITNHASQS